jgi:hypothetical protein
VIHRKNEKESYSGRNGHVPPVIFYHTRRGKANPPSLHHSPLLSADPIKRLNDAGNVFWGFELENETSPIQSDAAVVQFSL